MASLTIINFHGIGDPPAWIEADERPYWIPVSMFEELIALAATFRDMVRITFDDGNASDHDIALPRLLAAGLKADFFLLAGRIDTAGYVTRTEARRLADAGMGVGLHGHAHVDWRAIDKEEADLELKIARAQLADVVGAPVDTAAIPFGKYDSKVIARLRKEGFRKVFTSDGGPTAPTRWLQPRTSIRFDTQLEQLEHQILNGPDGLAQVRRYVSMAYRRHLKSTRKV